MKTLLKFKWTFNTVFVGPKNYLFNVTNADDSLRQAVDSALRFVIGHTSMDDVLTTGREVVRQSTREHIESIIEKYNMGIETG